MTSWHAALPRHPLLERQARADTAGDVDITSRSSLMAVRGTDLLAVVQNEIRIASLAQAKRMWDDGDHDVSGLAYKVRGETYLDAGVAGP